MSNEYPDNYSGDPYNPDAYYAPALEYSMPGITTTIAEQQTGTETWMDTLQRMLATLLTTDMQRRELQVQIERARAGLVPYNYTQAGANNISPTTLLIFGGILVGVMAISTRRGGKRR